MHPLRFVFIPLVIASTRVSAQSLVQRVAEADGIVEVIFPSLRTACGDGQGMIGGVFGRSTYYSGTSTYSEGGRWMGRSCVHGPARAVATVVDRQVTRIRTFVGPVPMPRSDTRTITASAREASGWLGEIITRNNGKSASEAMLPLVLAEGSNPWPLLLHVARDEHRSHDVRRAAIDRLSRGVNDHLGLAEPGDQTDDDEMRSQAVFVLSQRPKSESVPDLIDLARSAKFSSVRRSAIFWLGQTGDSRAIDVYAELLGIR